MIRSILFLFALLTLFLPTPGRADVFRYIDKNGAVAFTDNIENVPQEQRPAVQKIEPTPSPSAPTPTPALSHPRPTYDRWIDNPLSKYMMVFIALSIVMLFVQHKTESFLLKMVMKLLFVGFLGAAIYSVVVMQDNPLSPAALQNAAAPYLPTPAPINEAKKAVGKVEAAQKQQEAEIEKMMRSVDNPNQ
ncbi:MAG: DUF4124 domain-containing protein [Nitrospirae bacterium]|nr:DUF4124 domain-containing protein [Candidatus Manganitrophaceae bacterium]